MAPEGDAKNSPGKAIRQETFFTKRNNETLLDQNKRLERVISDMTRK